MKSIVLYMCEGKVLMDKNVLRWFGHVERMDNERMLKKVMNAKVDWRSARGRPRFGWMDGVKRALNDRRMDITIREASERDRNRNEWRMIVSSSDWHLLLPWGCLIEATLW